MPQEVLLALSESSVPTASNEVPPADPVGETPVQPPPPSLPPSLHNNRGSYSEVLAHKHYRNVLLAQFLSNIGTWTEMFAIQVFVADRTGSLADQGILGALSTLPIFVFGLLGGVVADRSDQRKMLIITQILASVVAFGVVAVSLVRFDEGSHTPVYWFFALSTINSIVMAFNFPAWQVLTPRLVPRDLLTRAIALNGIQFNLARVLGPAMAGAVLAQWASPPLFVFNAFSFLLVAAVVATTPKPPITVPDPRPVLAQIASAWEFIRRSRGPWAVFLAQVLISFLAAPMVRLLTLFVIDVYGMPKKTAETTSGIMLAVQGVGAVIGGLALRYVPAWYPKHHFIPLSVAALGASITLFAATTSLWAGYGAMLIVGFFWIWCFNQSWAAMQVLSPDEVRGRVLSLTTVASFGATGIGVFLAGLLGEGLKDWAHITPGLATQLTVAALGVPLLIGGVFMLMHRTPEVDGMTPAPPGTRPSRNPIRAALAVEHWPKE